MKAQQNFFAESNLGSGNGFERFWSLYPRKVGKHKASEEWTKLRPNIGLTEVIIAAVEDHRKLEQWQNPRLTPHASTWLHQRRWQDDISHEPRALQFLEEP